MISGDLKYDHGRNNTVSERSELKTREIILYDTWGSDGVKRLQEGRVRGHKAKRGGIAKGCGQGIVAARAFTRHPFITPGGLQIPPLA